MLSAFSLFVSILDSLFEFQSIKLSLSPSVQHTSLGRRLIFSRESDTIDPSKDESIHGLQKLAVVKAKQHIMIVEVESRRKTPTCLTTIFGGDLHFIRNNNLHDRWHQDLRR